MFRRNEAIYPQAAAEADRAGVSDREQVEKCFQPGVVSGPWEVGKEAGEKPDPPDRRLEPAGIPGSTRLRRR